MTGQVTAIGITATGGAPMTSVSRVEAVAGQGLRGDRYFDATGTFSKKEGPDRELTLIESEAIEALAKEYGAEMLPIAARRNVVTRGIALNHLVGRRFRVGSVLAEGIRLCEPCGHMESLTVPKAREGLIHRGGLRARIVEGGVIQVGDPIRAEPST